MLFRSNIFSQTINTTLNFLYPTQCRVCESYIGIDTVPYLCDNCWDQIDFVKSPWCRICGLPEIEDVCSECATNPPRYGKLRTIACYEGALQDAIHLFKFEKRLNLSKYLIRLTIENMPFDLHLTEYDYIVPMPIHRIRMNERGFNQSYIISKGISQAFNVDVNTDVLIRRLNTSRQSSLDKEKRLQNIKGAFELQMKEQIQGKNILVFDDVYTTGATVREAVNVLWDADPSEVDVLTVARTLKTKL